jgi:hypothetical protein
VVIVVHGARAPFVPGGGQSLAGLIWPTADTTLIHIMKSLSTSHAPVSAP